MMSSQSKHDVTDGHPSPQRDDTTSPAAVASAGSETGGEETKSGKGRSGGGGKTTGGGSASLETEPTALLSAPESGAAGAGAGTEGDGNDQKNRSGKHNLKKTAARLAMQISETSMVRRGDHGFHSHPSPICFSEVGGVFLRSVASVYTRGGVHT